VRHGKAALVQDYRRRLVTALDGIEARAPMRATIDDEVGPEPDVGRVLADGEALLLLGGSGAGKSHLAEHGTRAFANAGNVPIWLNTYAFDGDFETFMAQATAPYTTASPNELIDAALETGSAIGFVVDGINECDRSRQMALLKNVGALSVVGQALHDGLFVEGVVALLESTDEHGATVIRGLFDRGGKLAISRYVAATYGIGFRTGSTALGASMIVHACEQAGHLAIWRSSDRQGDGIASAALRAGPVTPRWGVLYLFMSLFRPQSTSDCDALADALDAQG
jgi:energy-coupling factor transporter ATP-binding protein EcfA2